MQKPIQKALQSLPGAGHGARMRFYRSPDNYYTYPTQQQRSIRQQSRFSGLSAGILAKPLQYAVPTHEEHVLPHCTPTNNSFFPSVLLLPAQLKPDTTAEV